jgi:hypothetical protein
MPDQTKGYWWECENEKCGATSEFQEICETKSIYGFIWDVLLPSDWDQTLLLRKCPQCNETSARIAYKFPRLEELLFRVVHIVGFLDAKDNYLPMMWAAYCVGDRNTLNYDFKYLIKGSLRGLSSPAIFAQGDLRNLFALYCNKTGMTSFP